jgi:hypothetical protein
MMSFAVLIPLGMLALGVFWLVQAFRTGRARGRWGRTAERAFNNVKDPRYFALDTTFHSPQE